MRIRLTIGLSTYDDFDGVYFTVQSLRMHHEMAKQADVEIIVLDNHPQSAAGQATRSFMNWVPNGRYIPYEGWIGTAARTLLFEQLAQGEIVVCLDAHVLLQPGALDCLVKFYEQHPDSPDLLQGPMLYDDLQGLATHMEPIWRAQMLGIWGYDPRGRNPAGEPFEIPMHGLGLFACRRKAWLGIHHGFQGFGGEEGYIHEKFRQAGQRTLCLPGFRWLHRFPRPAGVPFPALLHDKIRNYFIGHGELGLDLTPIKEHFSEFLSHDALEELEREANELRLDPPDRPSVQQLVHPTFFLDSKQLSASDVPAHFVAPRANRTHPCAHLGKPTGEIRQCPTCRGHVQVKLMHCETHGTCTVGKRVDEISCCQSCPDYQSTLENTLTGSLSHSCRNNEHDI